MTYAIPATCIPDLNVSFDQNRDWPCKRAHRIYILNVFEANIESARKSLAKARSAYVARNLTSYIEGQEARMPRTIERAEAEPCTCRESGLYG